MESWKRELYHYGVKGMKWGKHKTPFYKYEDSRRGTIEKAIGMYTESRKNNPYAHNIQVGYTKGKGGTSVYLHNTRNNTYFKSGETNTGSSKGAFKKSYAEDGANYSVNLTVLKSATKRTVKSITESNTKKVKNWISTRPKVVKKKVSEIKEKIAKAESGKKTVTYPLSRDANKKKTKKSTIKSSSHYMSNY